MKIISELDEIKKKDAELKEREALLQKRELELSKEVDRSGPLPSLPPSFHSLFYLLLFLAFVFAFSLPHLASYLFSDLNRLQDEDNNHEAAALLRRIKTCPAPRKGGGRHPRPVVKTDHGSGAEEHADFALSPKAQTPLSPIGRGDGPLSPTKAVSHTDLLLDNQVLSPKKLEHPLHHVAIEDSPSSSQPSPMQVEPSPLSHESLHTGSHETLESPEPTTRIAALKMVPSLGDSPATTVTNPADVALADSPHGQTESPVVLGDQAAHLLPTPDSATMQTDSPSVPTHDPPTPSPITEEVPSPSAVVHPVLADGQES